MRQFSEEDCGAACLTTVCRSHGLSQPLWQLRALVGTSSHGTTLLGLRRGGGGGEDLGCHARAPKADASLLEQLEGIPLPLICHWRGNHWVVLHGRRGSRLLVADPARGLVLLETRDFLNGWEDGILLLLEPDPQRFPPEVARTDAGRQTSLSVIGRYVGTPEKQLACLPG